MSSQFAEFVVNHWSLVSAFVVVLIMLIWNVIKERGHGTEIGIADAIRLINHEHAAVIDVREKADYTSGHIIDAINIPQSQFASRLKELDKFRNKPIILCSQSGDGTGPLATQLVTAGFAQIYRLREGMLTWQGANQPIVKG
jgi:rhodanese-related sulfurtransferase